MGVCGVPKASKRTSEEAAISNVLNTMGKVYAGPDGCLHTEVEEGECAGCGATLVEVGARMESLFEQLIDAQVEAVNKRQKIVVET